MSHDVDAARSHRRLLACGAIVALVAALGVTAVLVWQSPVRVVAALALVIVAITGAWMAVVGRSRLRVLWLVVAVVATAGLVLLLVSGKRGGVAVALVAGLSALSFALARRALRPLPSGRRVAAPSRAVLFVNPKSGGGKAEQLDLAGEARRLGVEPVMLRQGDDLKRLAEDAVARGADCLGMAGGDGSQAIVAGVAAAHDLAFVPIPSGTRNHFALDLGIDRNDVVGAMAAFTDAREQSIDLAEVNGEVFVNNVSLGVYAKIVQSPEYRDNKLQTAASMLPELLGPDAEPLDLTVEVPGTPPVVGPQIVQISNNPYQLTRLAGFGTRPSLATGTLGVVVLRIEGAGDVAKLVALETAGHLDRFAGFEHWEATDAQVTSDAPVEAGVDGEAVTLQSPLRFRLRPGALRIRVAAHHPGVSPSAGLPTTLTGTVVALGHVVAGRR